MSILQMNDRSCCTNCVVGRRFTNSQNYGFNGRCTKTHTEEVSVWCYRHSILICWMQSRVTRTFDKDNATSVGPEFYRWIWFANRKSDNAIKSFKGYWFFYKEQISSKMKQMWLADAMANSTLCSKMMGQPREWKVNWSRIFLPQTKGGMHMSVYWRGVQVQKG